MHRLTECGCVFVFWVADWFAKLNNKMGGGFREDSAGWALLRGSVEGAGDEVEQREVFVVLG